MLHPRTGLSWRPDLKVWNEDLRRGHRGLEDLCQAAVSIRGKTAVSKQRPEAAAGERGVGWSTLTRLDGSGHASWTICACACELTTSRTRLCCRKKGQTNARRGRVSKLECWKSFHICAGERVWFCRSGARSHQQRWG